MYSNKKAKQYVHRNLAVYLEERAAHLTTAHIGPAARQQDVGKVKDMMLDLAKVFREKAGDGPTTV